MSKHPGDSCTNVCKQLELLLQQQHQAMLRDDLDAVEEKGREILSIAAGLSDEQKKVLGQSIDRIRKIHDQMSMVLCATKERTAAELATTRQKRSLNKSYGVYNG